MAKKKKKKKPITFKFVKKDGGAIEIKGLWFDPDKPEDQEELPKEIFELLENYGFCENANDCEWVDCCAPGNGMSLEDDLECMASYTDVRLVTRPPKSKKGSIAYLAEFGGTGMYEAKNPSDALLKAHRAWNREGRPMMQSSHFRQTVTVALQQLLQKLNLKRG